MIKTPNTVDKKSPKTMIKRYFGDYLYQLDTSMYEDKGWVDNSSSGNLCGITSLVLNPKFKKELTKVGVDMSVEGVKRLIAECMLRSNIYKDSKLHRSSLAKIEEIHRYIARKLKDKIIFNVKYIRADINLRNELWLHFSFSILPSSRFLANMIFFCKILHSFHRSPLVTPSPGSNG